MREEECQVLRMGEYLYISSPDCCDKDECAGCIDKLYEAIEEEHTTKVLLDLRNSNCRMPVLELWEMGNYMAERNYGKFPKIALLSAEGWGAREEKFFESVVRNRGVDLMDFVNDQDAALEWLMK